jgi:hypothetical protein
MVNHPKNSSSYFFGILAVALLMGVLASGNAFAASSVDEKKDVELELARFFRSARAVIAKNLALINDPEKGDKGLNADKVIADAKNNYKEAAGREFQLAAKGTFKEEAQSALLTAVKEVMTQAQPLINEKGKGFKGFIPAVFGKQVADSFNKIIAGKAHIKLTAPKDYIRNRANRPDEWENNVIENQFKKAGYEKDKPFIEPAPHNGKPALRLLIPEYYGEACLTCHGEPKGEKDITGSKKEGAKLGDLGGAISIAIYD